MSDPSRTTAPAWYVWDAPHKPLFLAAFLWSLVAILWWPLGTGVGLPPPAFDPAVLWHAHELIFGAAGAAIGGYLLTALPGWTGRDPATGRMLKTIVLFWVLARGTTATAGYLPPALTIAVNSGYFLLLAGYLFRQIAQARVFRKAGFCVALLALGLGDALFLRAALSGQVETALFVARLGVLVIAIMMAVIAGLAVPAFTQNWLWQTSGRTVTIPKAPVARALALFCLVVALLLTLLLRPYESGAALIAAAVLLLWAARRWRMPTALSDPLVAAMHLGFLWLPAGLATIGLVRLFPGIYPEAAALHALTIGAMSGLIVAISGRAAAWRGGATLRAGPTFVVAVLAIWLATWLRLAAPVFPAHSAGLITLAGALWSAGWAAHIAGFLRVIRAPAIRPVLSGSRFNADIS